MENQGIEHILTLAEESEGGDLSGTGFWPAVSKVKRNPEMVERYAERIAAVDDAAFRRWALVVVPVIPGTILALVATAIGVLLIGWAYSLEGLGAVAAFYVGFGIILVTTHGLAHLVVGWLLGIRFSAWFVGTIRRPQPGVKVDYQSYLRAPASHRAWMHASGAIVTKIVPFFLIGGAIAAGLPQWAVWGLAVIGVASIVTDVLWSTKASDWKKFKREMALAHNS